MPAVFSSSSPSLCPLSSSAIRARVSSPITPPAAPFIPPIPPGPGMCCARLREALPAEASPTRDSSHSNWRHIVSNSNNYEQVYHQSSNHKSIVMVLIKRETFGPILGMYLEMLAFTYEKCLWKSLRLWGDHIVIACLHVYVCGFRATWHHCISWLCWIGMFTGYVISYLTQIRVYSNIRPVHLFKFLPESSFLPSLFILLSPFGRPQLLLF